MTAPIAHATALAANGSWRGPRLSSAVPTLAAVAPTKIAANPAAGTCRCNADEHKTSPYLLERELQLEGFSVLEKKVLGDERPPGLRSFVIYTTRPQ